MYDRKCLNVFALSLLAGSTLAVSSNADEGFSNRGTQNRQTGGQPQTSRQGQDPRAFEGRQQHAAPTQAQLDEMRAKMKAQGVDPATIEQRIKQMQQHAAGGPQFNGRPAPTQAQLDELRVKLKAQGLDSATIEQRIAQMQQPQPMQHGAGGFQGASGGSQFPQSQDTGARSAPRGFDRSQAATGQAPTNLKRNFG